VNAYTDPTPDHERSAAEEALRREIAAVIVRWQQAGVAPFDIAMLIATVACQTLGHALGHIPPPEGPELIQQIAHHLQREAEACYFAHWQHPPC
jgi:hypothetical protein